MKPRLWIKIDLGERGQIGPGKIALLEAIDRERSIAGAARSMKMSYRRAWLLVDDINKAMREPVVETHVGGRGKGGAKLTGLGVSLVGQYRALQDLAEDRLDGDLARLKDLLA